MPQSHLVASLAAKSFASTNLQAPMDGTKLHGWELPNIIAVSIYLYLGGAKVSSGVAILYTEPYLEESAHPLKLLFHCYWRVVQTREHL